MNDLSAESQSNVVALSTEQMDALKHIQFLIDTNLIFVPKDEVANLEANSGHDMGPSMSDFWTLASELEKITGVNYDHLFDGAPVSGSVTEEGRTELAKSVREILRKYDPDYKSEFFKAE